MASDGEEGVSDVMKALLGGDRMALAEALETGGDANARDRWGAPALAIAAGRGDVEAVSLLLAHGGDPNLASTVGNTSLMIAAARGRLEAARALLDAGADPAAANDWGHNASDWAQWAKDPAEIRALFADRESQT